MKEKVFNACLAYIEKEGWGSFSFAKAAQASGMPLKDFHDHFSCPAAVIAHLFQKVDNEVLKKIEPSEDMSARDALFDILMTRFDVAEKYRPALQKFWQSWILTPEEMPFLVKQGFSSMAWMLEAAGLSPRGLKGMLRIQGLTTLYLLTVRVWLEDSSEDLGKTMAFLDKGLARCENFASFLNYA